MFNYPQLENVCLCLLSPNQGERFQWSLRMLAKKPVIINHDSSQQFAVRCFRTHRTNRTLHCKNGGTHFVFPTLRNIR